MKIHIVFPFVEGAYGGGNQFLKALKCHFIKVGVYAQLPENADVIIFNSHHSLQAVLRLRYRFPKKVFIHRIDGPMVFYKDGDMYLDRLVFKFCSLISDGVVFQSQYSKIKCLSLGLKKNENEIVISNAPDPSIFNDNKKSFPLQGRKVRLIATSWSSNPRKGFDIYQWIDENIDFNIYEMVFIGNSPIKFNNIRHIAPLSSIDLSNQLKKSDIFIYASKVESCSNSLLEAAHCGLPLVVFDSTGNIELVKDGGRLFREPNEIPAILEDIVNKYDFYKNNLKYPSIVDISNLYFNFSLSILCNSEYYPKSIAYTSFIKESSLLVLKKSRDKIKSIINFSG